MKKASALLYGIFFLIVIGVVGTIILQSSGRRMISEIRGFSWSLSRETVMAVNNTVEGALVSAQRETVIDLYGLLQRLLCKAGIDNVVKDAQGMLHQADEQEDEEKLALDAKNLLTLYDFSARQGAAFLYVQAPSDVLEGKTQLPMGIRDHTNGRIDRFLEMVSAQGIPFPDARSLYAGWPAEEVFYRTDHHWKTEAVFEAMCAIIGQLNQRYACSLDPDGAIRDMDRYNRHVLPGFQGSLGIRVGRLYAKEDELVILEPTYPVRAAMTFTKDGQVELQTSGDFMQAFIGQDYLQPSYKNKYNAFMHAKTSEGVIVNELAPNNLRCLLISDSFGRALAPYLSACFSQTVLLDPQEGRYREDYLAYIAAYRPDVVIVLFNGRSVFTDVPADVLLFAS